MGEGLPRQERLSNSLHSNRRGLVALLVSDGEMGEGEERSKAAGKRGEREVVGVIKKESGERGS